MAALYQSRDLADSAVEKLRVYAQPQRLMILSCLLHGERTVSDIDAATAIGQPAAASSLNSGGSQRAKPRKALANHQSGCLSWRIRWRTCSSTARLSSTLQGRSTWLSTTNADARPPPEASRNSVSR